MRAHAVMALIAAATLWWAMAPLSRRHSEPVRADDGPPVRRDSDAFDEEAFSAPLWRASPPPAPAPPAPALPPKPEPPPPPLRLQLLAIVPGDHGGEALLYDPDADRTRWVRAGQRVGALTVVSVTDRAVALGDGKGVRTLTLGEVRAAATALERAIAMKDSP